MSDRRLIEEWLPISEIGIEGTRERTPMTPFPAPNRLHVWWARRPLVASRAAVLGSLLPADADRERFVYLLGIHGNPVAAKDAVDRARRSGTRVANPYDYERAFRYSPSGADVEWMRTVGELPLRNPIVLDSVAGGGSIPFEGLRLGYSLMANDLNPVAVLVTAATIGWPTLQGSEDEFINLATEWRRRLDDRLAALFSQEDEPDQLDATYLWAHTVTCSYCNGVVPLSPNWKLAPDGTGVRLRPRLDDGPGSRDRICEFELVESVGEQSAGTVSRGSGRCPFPDCERVIGGDEIKRQARDGEMGHQLYTVVYKKRVPRILKSGKRGKDKWVRGYRAPRASDDNRAEIAERLEEKLPEWLALDMVPSEEFPSVSNDDRPLQYGMPHWRDLFSPRQLLCHGTSVEAFREMLEADRKAGELTEVRKAAYGYLALAMDKMLDYNSRMCLWDTYKRAIAHSFSQHDFSFKWSYAEMAPCVTGLGYDWVIDFTAKCIRELTALLRPQPHDNGPIFDKNDVAASVAPPRIL